MDWFMHGLQDVPSIPAGTFLDRMDAVLPFLPKSVQRIIRHRLVATQRSAYQQASLLQGRVATGIAQTTVDVGRKVATMGKPRHKCVLPCPALLLRP